MKADQLSLSFSFQAMKYTTLKPDEKSPRHISSESPTSSVQLSDATSARLSIPPSAISGVPRRADYQENGKWETVTKKRKAVDDVASSSARKSTSSNRLQVPDHLKEIFGSDDEEQLGTSVVTPAKNGELLNDSHPDDRDSLKQIDVLLALRRRYNMMFMKMHRRRWAGQEADPIDLQERKVLDTLKGEPNIMLPKDLPPLSPRSQSHWKYAHDLTRTYQEADHKLAQKGIIRSKWNPNNLPNDLHKFKAWKQLSNREGYIADPAMSHERQ